MSHFNLSDLMAAYLSFGTPVMEIRQILYWKNIKLHGRYPKIRIRSMQNIIY